MLLHILYWTSFFSGFLGQTMYTRMHAYFLHIYNTRQEKKKHKINERWSIKIFMLLVWTTKVFCLFLHHTSPNTNMLYALETRSDLFDFLWCTFSFQNFNLKFCRFIHTFMIIVVTCVVFIIFYSVFGGGCIAKKHVKWSCHGILCCKIILYST